MSTNFLTSKLLCVEDYYQKNWSKTFNNCPTFLFDLLVTREDEITLRFRNDYENLKFKRILILSPNGRVIKSSNTNHNTITFKAKEGKYVVKYWMVCYDVTSTNDHLYYYMDIYSKEQNSIDIESSKCRVWSLLGASREGNIYKGENLKEKCLERYIAKHH